MLSVFLIAVSLALDAFAVSVSTGIAMPGFRLRHAVKMGVWFGAFQFFMPLIGWALGTGVSAYIRAVDHFIAFGLLALIGGRMVCHSLRPGGEEDGACPDLSPGGCACWPWPPASTPWRWGCPWPSCRWTSCCPPR